MTNNGPRVPVITNKNQLPADKNHNYDLVEEPRGQVSDLFGALLNHPEIGGRIGHLGAYIRYEGELEDPIRELAILTTSYEFDCPYEWSVHEPIARDAGVSPKTIETLIEQKSIVSLKDKDQMVIEYGHHLFQDKEIPNELFNEAKDQLGVTGIIELTSTMGYYGMLACIINALDIKPEGDKPF